MKRLAYAAFGFAAVLVLGAGCHPRGVRVYGGYASYAVSPPPPPALEVSARLVYDDLALYGAWTEHVVYGPVWRPRGVPRLWRPYTHGHWVLSDDCGWVWVSDWPWGLVPFHYGRWVWDPPLGWVWVPGTEWAPAWVTWRSGGGYVGWAPLPPEVAWSVEIGLRFGPRGLDAIPPDAWCFVPDRYLLEPAHRYAVAPARNVTIINVTRNVTNIVNVRGRPVNHGFPPSEVHRATGRPVPRARLHDVRSPEEWRRTPGRADEVPVFRPLRQERLAPPSAAPPRQERPAPPSAAPPRQERPAPPIAAPSRQERPAPPSAAPPRQGRPAPPIAAPLRQERPAPPSAAPVRQERLAPPSAAPLRQERPAPLGEDASRPGRPAAHPPTAGPGRFGLDRPRADPPGPPADDERRAWAERRQAEIRRQQEDRDAAERRAANRRGPG